MGVDQGRLSPPAGSGRADPFGVALPHLASRGAQASSRTVARYVSDGTWERQLQRVQAAADAAGEIDWDIAVDSTLVRAHQHAVCARTDPPPTPASKGAGSGGAPREQRPGSGNTALAEHPGMAPHLFSGASAGHAPGLVLLLDDRRRGVHRCPRSPHVLVGKGTWRLMAPARPRRSGIDISHPQLAVTGYCACSSFPWGTPAVDGRSSAAAGAAARAAVTAENGAARCSGPFIG